jgi:hypothetical protein
MRILKSAVVGLQGAAQEETEAQPTKERT